MEDKVLTCRSCGTSFVFSREEQEFFARHGLHHEPKHCRECRQARRAASVNTGPVEVLCACCGAATLVPFFPRGEKPIFCRACLRALYGQR
ncbi:MAG: zinc-binding protein [Firmicutes bacterium]|nr:zinc-binding protein [Bacillota bacterium]